jgi:hypothetical protein
MALGITRKNCSVFLQTLSISNNLTIGSGQANYGYQVSTFTAQYAAISSGQTAEVTLTTAATLAILGDLVSVEGRATPSVVALCGWRLSTVATSNVTLLIANPGSTASSTGRITGSIAYIDLTP